MDKRIVDFIEQQRTASICCLDEKNDPYCFSVFFIFDKESHRLYFKSSYSTNHSKWLLKNRRVAGTILPDKLNLLAIRGVQFTGLINESVDDATSYYHRRLPLAVAMPGEVWTIQLETIKLTDNTIGIGKKVLWNREAEYEFDRSWQHSPDQ